MSTILALIAPAFGAFLAFRFIKIERERQILHGAILSFLVFLLVLDWIPTALAETGFAGVFALGFGYLLATRMEVHTDLKPYEADNNGAGLLSGLGTDILWLIGGALVHILSDGLTLGFFARVESENSIVWGMLLHRLLFGASIVGAMSVMKKERYTWHVIIAAILTALLGYLLAYSFSGSVSSDTTGAFSISAILPWLLLFVTGGLGHVIAHLRSSLSHNTVDGSSGFGARTPASLGAALGLVVAILSLASHTHLGHELTSEVGHLVGQVDTHTHGEHHLGVAQVFWSFFKTSAPALLLAYFVAGMFSASITDKIRNFLSKGSPLIQSLKGVAVGLPLPICSCGIVPLYREMTQAGVPIAAAVAFLIATPEIGFEAFLLSFPLLGTEMTLIRLGAAAVFALSISILMHAFFKNKNEALNKEASKKSEEESCCAATSKNEKEEVSDSTFLEAFQKNMKDAAWWNKTLEKGFIENGGDTLPWILVGLMLAAFVPTEGLDSVLMSLPFGFDIIIAAVIGIPLYICASGATPMVAALLLAGVSPGAGLTMLLVGPATNITTFGVLQTLHGKSFAQRFMLVSLCMAILIGFSVNLFTSPTLVSSDILHSEHHFLEVLSAFILLFVIALNIYRHGLNAFVDIVLRWLPGLGGHHHDHDDATHKHDGDEHTPGEAPSCCS